MKITAKNYKEIKHSLVSFLFSEINVYISRAGSPEKLSLLLGRSRTYVRMKLSRATGIEKLEGLWEECGRKVNNHV